MVTDDRAGAGVFWAVAGRQAAASNRRHQTLFVMPESKNDFLSKVAIVQNCYLDAMTCSSGVL